MKVIELTKGQVTVVDDEDFDLIDGQSYFAHSAGDGYGFYAARNRYDEKGVQRTSKLHREIMERVLGRNLTSDEEVDHEDLDKLNNRRRNLRLADRFKNNQNKGIRSSNTSGYVGVWWNKRDKRWYAQILSNGERKHIGCFKNPDDAARAYDTKAKELKTEL